MMEEFKIVDAFNDVFTKWTSCSLDEKHSDVVDDLFFISISALRHLILVRVKFACFATNEQMKRICSIALDECDRNRVAIQQKAATKIRFHAQQVWPNCLSFFTTNGHRCDGIITKRDGWVIDNDGSFAEFGELSIIVDFHIEPSRSAAKSATFKTSTMSTIGQFRNLVEMSNTFPERFTVTSFWNHYHANLKNHLKISDVAKFDLVNSEQLQLCCNVKIA